MSVFSVSALQRSTLEQQIEQHHPQGIIHLKPHYSSLLLPREDRKVPTANNIADTTKEAIERLQENSCLTKGCITAKTTIAVPMFKTVLPSSLRPLNQFIREIITL